MGVDQVVLSFLVVLFIMLSRWSLLLILWMKSLTVTIQMKPIEQHFPVVLFITLFKVVLTFEFVDEILLKRDHSNENC